MPSIVFWSSADLTGNQTVRPDVDAVLVGLDEVGDAVAQASRVHRAGALRVALGDEAHGLQRRGERPVDRVLDGLAVVLAHLHEAGDVGGEQALGAAAREALFHHPADDIAVAIGPRVLLGAPLLLADLARGALLAHALPIPVKKGPGSPPASSVVGAFTP